MGAGLPASVVADLYARHGHSVLRRATRLLGRAEDAEDVLHDVFVAMQRLPAHDVPHEPLHWLYRATTRACLNRLRSLRTRDRLRDTVALMERPPEQLSPEMASVLRQALQALPEELREVAVCAWLDRMTQAEIAEVIGCSRRTVSDHLARIRARLTSLEVEHGH